MGRRLGQHFLKDPAILERIVSALNPAPDDVVLEVGAGEGDLTRRISTYVNRVLSVELDIVLYQRLIASHFELNIEFIHGDALKLDWGELVGSAGFKVIGNVPYYITTPLIEKALSAPQPSTIVFLVQEEVADRLGAVPGTGQYGALTVGVGATANVEKLFRVKAGSFVVPPRVESAVVRITPLERPLIPPAARAEFRRFVAAVFSKRRKQMRGILRSTAGLDAASAESVLEKLGIEPSARPETMSVATFAGLFGELKSVD